MFGITFLSTVVRTRSPNRRTDLCCGFPRLCRDGSDIWLDNPEVRRRLSMDFDRTVGRGCNLDDPRSASFVYFYTTPVNYNATYYYNPYERQRRGQRSSEFIDNTILGSIYIAARECGFVSPLPKLQEGGCRRTEERAMITFVEPQRTERQWP